MSTVMDRAEEALRTSFGYPSFRPGQREIVDAVLHGRDVVGVMPTGGGKSLCYQVPALVFPACTLVISPLIALMLDQVRALKERGIAAEAIHSDMSTDTVQEILLRAQRKELKLLYIAPERLEQERFRQELARIPLSLLAVDEAHCISEWGHDFRPAYRSISKLFDTRQRVPVIAVTATATQDVKQDIVRSLELKKPVEVVHGFDRPNLAFKVVSTQHKIEFIAKEAIENSDAPMIVYAGTRKRVHEITEELKKRNVASAMYHAGLPHTTRMANQGAFLADDVQVLVATNAFGMGVDKPNVRRVFHTDLTLTLEAYYQEAGRAGRDGEPAECVLLYQPQDRGLMDFFVASTYPDSTAITMVSEYLYDRANLMVGGSADAAIQTDAQNIAADIHKPLSTVRGVLGVLEREGVLVQTSSNGTASMRLRSTPQRLQEFVNNAPASRKEALQLLERSLTHSVQSTAQIPMAEIVRSSGITPHELSEATRALQAARLISYLPPEQGGGVLLLRPRPNKISEVVDIEGLRVRREHAQRKLDAVIRYASTDRCKRNTILEYFGDTSFSEPCGRCSSCLALPNTAETVIDVSDLAVNIIRAVHEVGGRFGRHVIADIVSGTMSERVVDYRLNELSQWKSAGSARRPQVLNEMTNAFNNGWLQTSVGDYPTLQVTEDGAQIAAPLPRQRTVARSRETKGLNKKIMAELMALRERLSSEVHSSPLSILSNETLEHLATDAPTSVRQLVPGRHGSGVTIARHGEQIVSLINGIKQVDERAVPKVRLDDDVERVLRAVTPSRTVEDVARAVRMTPAAVARSIQRAIELGLPLEIGSLVPERDYAKVVDYMREHRFAKIRHVREDVSADLDLPTLRVAMAFARQHLFGVS